jgi:hypothetical protein
MDLSYNPSLSPPSLLSMQNIKHIQRKAKHKTYIATKEQEEWCNLY